MKLILLSKPTIQHTSEVQKVIVTYDPVKELTIVDLDIDIVTLGIVVNVLQEQYENCLGKVDCDIAEQIKTVTRKAVSYGQN